MCGSAMRNKHKETMKENDLSKLIEDFMWDNSLPSRDDKLRRISFTEETGIWIALAKKIDEFHSKIKKAETCKEYWDKLPFTSKHVFATDGTVHENPTRCIHCEKPHRKYQDECLERAKKMPEINEVIKDTQIKINKLSDAKPS